MSRKVYNESRASNGRRGSRVEPYAGKSGKLIKNGVRSMVPVNAPDLKAMTSRLNQVLNEASCVCASFILRAHVQDFVVGIQHLRNIMRKVDEQRIANAANVDKVNEKLKPIVRRLCDLSRDIQYFDPLSRLPAEMREAIDGLFRLAVIYVPDSKDKELQAYKDNIQIRTL